MQVPDILFLTPSRDELLKLKLSVIRQKHMAYVLRSCCLMGGGCCLCEHHLLPLLHGPLSQTPQ